MTKKPKGRNPNKIRLALPPPGMRPKLDTAKIWAMTINMQTNLDALATSTADEQIMWDFVEGTMMFLKIAQSRGHTQAHKVMIGVREDVVVPVLHRWCVEGNIDLRPHEVQIVQDSIAWAEALAEDVDVTTAKHASAWSADIGRRMRAMYSDDRIKFLAGRARGKQDDEGGQEVKESTNFQEPSQLNEAARPRSRA